METAQGSAPKKFWESSNFWTAVFLFMGGLFVGFPEGEARIAVTSLFSLVAAVKAIREYFTELKPKADIGQAVNRSNWWNYLGTIVVAIVPALPVEAIDHLQHIATNIVGKNWQGALVSLFSLVTILYNLYWKNKSQLVKAT